MTNKTILAYDPSVDTLAKVQRDLNRIDGEVVRFKVLPHMVQIEVEGGVQ